jgi:hypothetical protein
MNDLHASSLEPAAATTVPASAPASAQGSVCAALVSAGLGCFLLGLTELLAAASPRLTTLFSFYKPSGALSGETTVAVVAWLAAWILLHRRWTARPPKVSAALVAAFVLLGLGLALTFPPLLDTLLGR